MTKNAGPEGSSTARDRPLVLIVDDLPKNVQILGSLLRQETCDIAVAVNGPQALDIARTTLPDLILLDVMIPEMDGFDVCRELKGDPKTMEIPIIFLTARTETDDIVKGFHTGAVDYVTKPFRSEELLARARTQLDLKAARDREKKLIADLRAALVEVKQLSWLLPICANCKCIRDDEGFWRRVEDYFSSHAGIKFSHGLCPACVSELYPEYAKRVAHEKGDQ